MNLNAKSCYNPAIVNSRKWDFMTDANSNAAANQNAAPGAPNVPPYAPPGMPYGAPGDVEANPDARMWGMFCHLFALSTFIIPVGSIIGPLIAWLIKKDQYPFVDDQGKESLNFQITMFIAMICAALTIFIFIGFLLLAVVGLFDLIFTIIAAIEANKGNRYRYPFAWRLIK